MSADPLRVPGGDPLEPPAPRTWMPVDAARAIVDERTAELQALADRIEVLRARITALRVAAAFDERQLADARTAFDDLVQALSAATSAHLAHRASLLDQPAPDIPPPPPPPPPPAGAVDDAPDDGGSGRRSRRRARRS